MKQIQTSSPLLVGFVESRIGGRAENQDTFGYDDTPFGFLITVCDGMGGGPGGKTASTIAVNEIIKGVAEANGEETVTNILIKAIRRANLAILGEGKEHPELQGMGSTCTVLLLNRESATVAHVGDSRIYQFRGKRKIFRTFDHSMVFDLVKQKVITEEQARLSAQSNVITRALGIKPDLKVEVKELPYECGDRFLLCTDGIHGAVAEKELIKLATDRKISLGTVVDGVAIQIDNAGRMAGGGHDNLTLAIIETKSKSILKEKMNKRIKRILYAVGIVCIVSLIVNIGLINSTINQKNKLGEAITITDSIKSLNKQCSNLKNDTAKLNKELNVHRKFINKLSRSLNNKDTMAVINLV